jgi:hypothetical protein
MSGSRPVITKPPPATGGRGSIPAHEQKTVRRLLQAAKARTDVPETEFQICDPQADITGGTQGRSTMERYMRERVEPEFFTEAVAVEAEGSKYQILVGETDKSKLSPTNHLGGREGAGDRALDLYFDIVGKAIQRVAGINGSKRLSNFLVRVSDASDEGVFAIGGITLAESPQIQFREAIAEVSAEFNLTDERYSYTVNVGEQEFSLNLKAFSRILRHPNVVRACDFTVCEDPYLVDPMAESGFLVDIIKELGNSEIWFRHLLPECLTVNGGSAEVRTPFKSNLTVQGRTDMTSGTFVEVKYVLPDEAEIPLLGITKDVHHGKELVQRGTRKGFAEIFSRKMGMRGLNTFVGKPVANGYMTPIAQALGDLAAGGITVIPISGSHLQYWVDVPAGDDVAKEVRRAVARRANSAVNLPDHTYMNLPLEADVNWVDATGMNIGDARAAFILKSLGREGAELDLLKRTDFLLNFLEYVRDDVQSDIIERLQTVRNGGGRVTKADVENMRMIREVCGRRKFTRDTEDLVWTLRMDNQLSPETNRRRDELEGWVFEFAWNRYEKMLLMLTERIEREMKKS